MRFDGSMQLAFTCYKLTKETLEQGVNIFHTLSSVPIVNFEQVNADWEMAFNL